MPICFKTFYRWIFHVTAIAWRAPDGEAASKVKGNLCRMAIAKSSNLQEKDLTHRVQGKNKIERVENSAVTRFRSDRLASQKRTAETSSTMETKRRFLCQAHDNHTQRPARRTATGCKFSDHMSCRYNPLPGFAFLWTWLIWGGLAGLANKYRKILADRIQPCD